jgi:hypothetical protein
MATADDIRATPAHRFLADAEAIVNSDGPLSIFASCEWDELGDDGKEWIAAIVRETRARAAEAGWPGAKLS